MTGFLSNYHLILCVYVYCVNFKKISKHCRVDREQRVMRMRKITMVTFIVFQIERTPENVAEQRG